MPPYVKIDQKRVTELRKLKVPWKEIATELHVSINKLLVWRREHANHVETSVVGVDVMPNDGTAIEEDSQVDANATVIAGSSSDLPFRDPLQTVNDQTLDELVHQYLIDNINRGEQMTAGFLLSKQVNVTRKRLRESIWRVDPDGREARRRKSIKRVVYNVTKPHRLWHIDGCHKGAKYGIVVHGGIDGFSRTVVFLRASNNNLPATMKTAYMEGVGKYGTPRTVRCDKGGENVDVGYYQVAMHGTGRGTFIAGPSTRNQRIERLWRDSTEKTLHFYLCYFEYLEDTHHYDLSKPAMRHVIHHLFMPRINADLDLFAEVWNHHSMRTNQGCMSPFRLLSRSAHLSQSTFFAPWPRGDAVIDTGVAADAGGADGVQEVSDALLAPRGGSAPDLPMVVVPVLRLEFTQAEIEFFGSRVVPFSLSDEESVMLPRIQAAVQVLVEMGYSVFD